MYGYKIEKGQEKREKPKLLSILLPAILVPLKCTMRLLIFLLLSLLNHFEML